MTARDEPATTSGTAASPNPVWAVTAACIFAASVPTLIAYNVSPSPTFLNQAAAFLLWGCVAMMSAARPSQPGLLSSVAPTWPALGAAVPVAAAAALSWGVGALPSSLAISALASLAGALLVAASAAAARAHAERVEFFAAFCLGWAVAGVLNLAVGIVQVFAPDLPDGSWIAHTNIVGRAVGNLRQPNHLSSVLLWSAIAVVALVELRRVGFWLGAVLFAAMVFGVVLTASRTGLLSVGLLALWGLADRRLSRRVRLLLVAAPLIYFASWRSMTWWAEAMHHTFGGTARLAETDISGSRFGIWANTLELIRQQPLAGVGFGEFNFAWTLTPFPDRPVAFFDHTHNLVLQLAVELGVPLTLWIVAVLVWALVLIGHRAFASQDAADSLCLRAALLMALMIALHSMVEYPLWYSYFLLPTAWVLGYGLGRPAAPSGHGLALIGGGALMAVLATASVWDYARVAEIFAAPDNAPPLEQRIARGQRSVLFSHHADYAAATTDMPPALREHAFERATHYLLDTRLMLAWAEDYADRGRLDEARHLAQRLREFRNPASKEFFEACAAPPASRPAALPFQCTPPSRVPGWREFLSR